MGDKEEEGVKNGWRHLWIKFINESKWFNLYFLKKNMWDLLVCLWKSTKIGIVLALKWLQPVGEKLMIVSSNSFTNTLKPQYSEQVCKNLFVHYIELFTTYIKCNMLSKSSKWELGFVPYIAEFIISRFVISRFEYTIKICIVETWG